MLLPDFVWTPRKVDPIALATNMPPTPKPSHPLVRRAWGYVHSFLRDFSLYYYCPWAGIPYDNQIIRLPFGLLLKWSDGTRVEEILATHVCYAAGFPTPRILCYGDHPETPWAPVSILMTKLPGREIGQAYPSLSPEAKATALEDMKLYLAAIRQWQSPWGPERICSITGSAIRSIRVPTHKLGPYETPAELHEHLLEPASNTFATTAIFDDHVARARELQLLQLQRPGGGVKFTHGDLKHHNILVDEHSGHVTGVLDWEAAGWYPEFWEYTTALRYLPDDFWWYHFLLRLGADKYLEEADCERSLAALAVDSWVW